MLVRSSVHSVAAAAAGSTPSAAAAAVVNNAIARSATVMLMIDHAATPAAPSSTLGAPKSPGTASANAAATDGSAAAARAVATRGDPDLASSAPSTAAIATPLTANTPTIESVTNRCATASAVATRISPTTASVAPRWMCVVPQGRSRAAEKIIAASAMSSTMRGAGGPAGTGCRASRSPSTTPTVVSVASRLYGAPPIGARLSSSAVPGVSSDGATMRWTAGMISRSGSCAGSATSVTRPPRSPSSPSVAVRTATRTIGIAALVVLRADSDISLLFCRPCVRRSLW